MSDDQRRRTRTEIRFLQSESVWLQKALFAIRKADAARERLADTRDEEVTPYTLAVGNSTLTVEALEDALEKRTTMLIETVRQMRRNLN